MENNKDYIMSTTKRIIRETGTDNSVSQQIMSVGSFKDRLIEVDDFIEPFENERAKGLEKLRVSNSRLLSCISDSKDKIAIDRVNSIDGNEEPIELFNSESDKVGKQISKVIAIKIINIIRSKDFRMSENGEEVYASFMKLVHGININALKVNGGILCDDEVIKNTLFYMSLGCDPGIATVVELSSSLNSLISCSIPEEDVYRTLIDRSNFERLNTEANNIILRIKDECLSETAELEKARSSGSSKIWKGIKFIAKSCFSSNPLVTGVQIGLVGLTVGYGANYLVPVILGWGRNFTFSNKHKIDVIAIESAHRESLENSETSIIDPVNVNYGNENASLFKSICKTLGDYLIGLSKGN